MVAPASALPSWLHDLELTGSFAASYAYNWLGPGPSIAPAAENGPLSNPFHPDHNTFQLDEGALQLERRAIAANSAGFALGVSYGRTAAILGNADGANSGNDFRLGRATVEWQTPWKIHLSAGKFPTHIGYEGVSASGSAFATRGIVYTALQPRDQVGARISGDCDCGVSWMLGTTNGFSTAATDFDDEKEFVWSFAYRWRWLRTAFQGQWGFDAESAGFGGAGSAEADSQLVVELLLEAEPVSDMSGFVDLTFREIATSGGRPWAVGVAVGGHRELSDRLTASGRFEYAHADSEGLAFRTGPVVGVPANLLAPGFAASELGAVSSTLSLDLAVVSGLVVRLEGKYEAVVYAEGGPKRVFNPDGSAGVPRDDDQFVSVLQLLYAF
jgi:hypothetical protein